jgi:hypothetical protein
MVSMEKMGPQALTALKDQQAQLVQKAQQEQMVRA